jgi:hypothetical protein
MGSGQSPPKKGKLRRIMTESALKKDLLSQLLYECEAYKKFEDIEKLVDRGEDLSMIPVQPLYVSLQNTSSDQIAAILPKLSSDQRQALRDIDLWTKDVVDPGEAIHWLEIYSRCPDDEIVLEYVKSEDFLLTLKNQFTVSTFDVEDPMYPDNDNYFLTEDNQLLIEYPEDFSLVQELKQMIRRLYGDMGVENAYAFLFKMVVDSYMTMEEECYKEKVERLRDFGFVDYYEALNFNAYFTSTAQIDDFIAKKRSLTGELDPVSNNQGLHSSMLVPYQNGMDSIRDALKDLHDEKRSHFLQFNFIRLVNARMTLENALKSGSLAMSKVGIETRQRLELGFEYVKEKGKKDIFGTFDFTDLHKIGHSLIEIQKRAMKKALAASPFDRDDFSYFLGMYWNSFTENSFDEQTKYKFDGSSKPLEIRDLATYRLWAEAVETFTTSLPFIEKFFQSLDKLKADGLLNDQFYLNYEVENIDFEAIMISSLINYVGGHYEDTNRSKMGVTVSELKSFYHAFFRKNGEEYLIKGEEDPVLRQKVAEFIDKFGLKTIPRFDKYLYQIMLEQLNGYEIDGMSEEEFKHVGGPILLNLTRN